MLLNSNSNMYIPVKIAYVSLILKNLDKYREYSDRNRFVDTITRF